MWEQNNTVAMRSWASPQSQGLWEPVNVTLVAKSHWWEAFTAWNLANTKSHIFPHTAVSIV